MWFRPSGRPISWASCSPHNGRSGPTRGRTTSWMNASVLARTSASVSSDTAGT